MYKREMYIRVKDLKRVNKGMIKRMDSLLGGRTVDLVLNTVTNPLVHNHNVNDMMFNFLDCIVE